MKIKFFSILVLLILFSLFLFITPKYTTYTTYQPVQPNIKLDLAKTTYNSNEYLDGLINITFKGPIEANSELILKIDNKEDKKTIFDVLFDLNKQPSIEYGGISLANDQQVKELIFNSAETKEIATQISSQVSQFSFNIEGLPIDNSYPKTVVIDILNDDILDYAYLGTFTNYKSEKIKAANLDLTASKVYHSLNKSNYYCELIDLPYAQHLKINAEYIGSGAVYAILFPTAISDDEITASYQSNFCTISSGTCTISLTKPIQGNNLVCIYTSSNNIKLAKEELNLQSSNGYICDINYLNKLGDSSLCTPLDLPVSEARLGDFFITVQVPDYSRELKTTDVFNADLTLISNYFSTCTSPCTIPISISSASKGKLKINNINIIYGSTQKNYLSDITQTPDILYKIDSQDLKELIVPLSIFNITVPEIIQNTKKLKVKVSLGTDTDEKTIDVYKSASADASSLASSLKAKFSSYTEQQKEIFSALGYNINSLIMQITNYQSLLNTTNTSQSDIKQSLETIQEETPSIKIQKTIKNIPTSRAVEIQDAYLEENQRDPYVKQQLLKLQSNIGIKTDLLVFKLIANDTEEKTLVKKTISGVLSDIYLIEEIPKSVSSNISEINFGTDNYEIVQSDPIVRWSVASLPFTISYILPGDIVDDFNKLITTAVPKTISYEPSEAYQKVKCGDNICTVPLEDKITCPEDCMKKINWWFVIVLFAILIGGVYYLNFYKGKLSYQQIVLKKPSLFKSKSDENNLRNYVKKALLHKISISRIRHILLSRGWSEEQINYVFRRLR